jgi:hypothetical protein
LILDGFVAGNIYNLANRLVLFKPEHKEAQEFIGLHDSYQPPMEKNLTVEHRLPKPGQLPKASFDKLKQNLKD